MIFHDWIIPKLHNEFMHTHTNTNDLNKDLSAQNP